MAHSQKNNPSADSLEVNDFVLGASKNNFTAVLEYLNLYGTAIINKKDSFGTTALIEAAGSGAKPLAEFLIARGADINAKTTGGGWTALLVAVNEERTETVKLLLEKGADTAIKNQRGDTALSLAQTRENPAILSLLLAQQQANAWKKLRLAARPKSFTFK